MAKTTISDHVIIIDDEIHNLTWMLDYLSSKDLNVITASTANDAVDVITKEIYRSIVVDLNIPILEPLNEAAKELGLVYAKYPGLFVARTARNKGYRSKQVVIYSVHKDAEVSEEANKLGCTYIIKGRPKEIKLELDHILSYDPTVED